MCIAVSGPISKIPLERLSYGSPRACAYRSEWSVSSRRSTTIARKEREAANPRSGRERSMTASGCPSRSATARALGRSPADRHGQRGMKPAQCTRRQRTDDSGASNDEHGPVPRIRPRSMEGHAPIMAGSRAGPLTASREFLITFRASFMAGAGLRRLRPGSGHPAAQAARCVGTRAASCPCDA